MTLTALQKAAAGDHLAVFGALHTTAKDDLPETIGTLVLLGPAEPGFWDHVKGTPEFGDGLPDPLDRWSTRVICALAQAADGMALFPFGGPPWRPFLDWALRSGRARSSPVDLLVHDTAGLFVSYRGAIGLGGRLPLPAAPPNPCSTCPDQPCRTACPVDALSPARYDVPMCRAYLNTAPGQDCMTRGCAVRRSCPVSAGYDRQPAQSAFHMRAFHTESKPRQP